MSKLTELIKRHNIEMTAIYTHTVNSGRGNTHDHDVYDALFTIDAGISLYGGRMNMRTMLVRDIGQPPALSQRNNGGELIPPDTAEVLHDLLDGAVTVDNEKNWRTWAIEYSGSQTFHDGMDAYGKYQEAKASRDNLVRFLGGDTRQWSMYDEFIRATQD